jgi:hypothetical protein
MNVLEPHILTNGKLVNLISDSEYQKLTFNFFSLKISAQAEMKQGKFFADKSRNPLPSDREACCCRLSWFVVS